MKFKLFDDLKLIMEMLSLYFKDEINVINDYIGENKYQLNYKKVIEEYSSDYNYDDKYNRLNLISIYDNMFYSEPMFHYRCYSDYDLHYYSYIHTKRGYTVGKLPKRYYYSNG